MEKCDAPVGWALSTIGSVYQVVGGGTPSTKNQDYWQGAIPWITSADINGIRDVSISRHISESAVENSATNKVPPQTLLVVTRVGLGKIAISETDICFSQDLQGLIAPPELISPEFALYYLSFALQTLKYEGRGTTISGITKKQLRDTSLPLPPRNEQNRIVAKIEELFSELDKGLESLNAAREQINVYRQAVLKHAFEGKLTEGWREKNQDKLETANEMLDRVMQGRDIAYQQQLEAWNVDLAAWDRQGQCGKKPVKPKKIQEPDKPNPDHQLRMWELPGTWQWLQIGSFAFVTKLAGFEYTKFVQYDENGDLAVLKAENAGPHGFRPTDYSHVQSGAVSQLSRSYLNGGELVVVFVGAGTGNVATVPSDQEYFLGPNIGMVRPDSKAVTTGYMEAFLRSPKGKDLLLSAMKAVAQPSLSMGTIRQCPIAIPSAIEQREIIERLTQTQSQIEHAEKDIDEQLNKAESLRQSILNRAFSGDLVPQDPNDEPASVLLERIKAEKNSGKTKAERR